MTEIDDTVARITEALRREIKEELLCEFREINPKELSKKSRKELIAWITKYPTSSPQYLLGQQELNRKSLSLQLKVAVGIAIFNAVVAIFIAFYKC